MRFSLGGWITKSPGWAIHEVSPTFAPAGEQPDRLRTGARPSCRRPGVSPGSIPLEALEWPANAEQDPRQIRIQEAVAMHCHHVGDAMRPPDGSHAAGAA